LKNRVVFDGLGKFSFLICAVCALLMFNSCGKNTESKLFVLKEGSGIEFSNELHPTPDLNVLNYLNYYNGGGVASGDFNNDGLIDLYFTGNQIADKLYLNQGGLQFKDITSTAGINNETGWTTGVTLVDINHDGLLDIYICKVGHFQKISGQNLLYVNQGPDKNGLPLFSEEAKKYKLDIKSYATQAAFFDYDLDGDLDMYLLNHSLYPNRTYGKGSNRAQIDSIAGDKLFQNQGESYIEVSQKAGIFQGKIGYGLGLGISDLNNDGYPDIYVGNDFFENDYLYINQKDGTFKEVISESADFVGHTSHSSMGNDIADIDNDGWTDIISLDMLPEDLIAYKTSGREYNNQIYNEYLKNGYRPQFMQNTLLRNNHGDYFQEMAFASGIAASDWSWAPLIVDLDNDGYKDLFVSNGILGATNDMDFINFIATKKIQEQINKGMEQKDLKFTEAIPQRKLSNKFFKNNGDLTFENTTNQWFENLPSFSNGSIYADLDNDGDQDLVVNNVNAKAFILENKLNTASNHFIKIQFKGPEKNNMGIGAKIKIVSDSLLIYHENQVSRGYLSAMTSQLTIGIGNRESIDSLNITWPGGASQNLNQIKAGSTLVLDYKMAAKNTPLNESILLSSLSPFPTPISFKHQELTSYEYGRELLIPYSKGFEGPKISVADINKDGLDDLYIGGGKKQAGSLYLQNSDASFDTSVQPAFEKNASSEETDNLFFDADNDGDQDLIVVSGGNEFLSGTQLQPSLYINESGIFKISTSFPKIELNASVVKSADLDGDGDQDLVIGANALPRKFGRSAKNYLLYNDGAGNFTDLSDQKSKTFTDIGLIEAIEIIDLNKDNLPDIVAVGHWMPISIFINTKQGFILDTNNNLNKSNGLWNTVRVADFDQDGDLDIVAGNWGLNTRLRASPDEPIQLYINDFDKNDTEEAILTYYDQGTETVFSSKDDLTKQIPSINKKFLSYTDFAKADFVELFDKELIKKATKKQVFELSSCYFENVGKGKFQKHKLPFLTQLSSVKTIYLHDFNQDGFTDVLLGGNDHDISTQLGRLDANHGLILFNDAKGSFFPDQRNVPNIPGKARDIATITIKDQQYLIVTLNNASPLFFKIHE
jgi:hypothetical protein